MKNISIISFILLAISVSNITLSQDINPITKEEKITQLLTITKSLEIGKQFASYFTRLITSLLQNKNPNLSDSVNIIIEEETNKLIDEDLMKEDGLRSMIVKIYEKYYTESDIDELLRFYNSPIGKKVISLNPKLLQESMEIGQNWGKSLAPELTKRLLKRLEKTGIDVSPLKII